MVEGFSPYSALLGGALIGLSAALLWIANGRIAGISGIVGGVLAPARGDVAWRATFLAGLFAAPLLYRAAGGALPDLTTPPPLIVVIAAGLLVGFGTRLGRGCTSGHGVCGIARLSPRSLAATGVFLIAAAVTVYVVRHIVGP
ncbi:MAG: YeeE/YedE family protein [Sphingomonas sp.]|uniref:YeeE/YedE family protein n=1 Tax=Sphingomonas sp. TaxID=28214 RepID=UPI002634E5C3|nr:YeeE/YedE family protein [Sphingomonas sp.]MDK2767984.1 YeeE/YedE family protein [Sphingomonas sp.]